MAAIRSAAALAFAALVFAVPPSGGARGDVGPPGGWQEPLAVARVPLSPDLRRALADHRRAPTDRTRWAVVEALAGQGFVPPDPPGVLSVNDSRLSPKELDGAASVSAELTNEGVLHVQD